MTFHSQRIIHCETFNRIKWNVNWSVALEWNLTNLNVFFTSIHFWSDFFNIWKKICLWTHYKQNYTVHLEKCPWYELCTKLLTKSMYKATWRICKSMTRRSHWNPMTIGLLAFNTIHKRRYLRRICAHCRFCHCIIGTEWDSSFWREPWALSIIFHFITLL